MVLFFLNFVQLSAKVLVYFSSKIQDAHLPITDRLGLIIPETNASLHAPYSLPLLRDACSFFGLNNCIELNSESVRKSSFNTFNSISQRSRHLIRKAHK